MTNPLICAIPDLQCLAHPPPRHRISCPNLSLRPAPAPQPLASDAAGVGSSSTLNCTGLNLGSDDCNHYMSWSLLLYSVTSMTLTDPKTGSLSLTIGTLSNTFHSAPSVRKRNISPGEDLIKTLVLFLTFAQLPFREAMVQAMSLVYFSMYLTLLKGLSGLVHHLTS